ncbi:MAG: fumarylacetoacetate hydrolase family protein [Alphaproteobacteria bacterium]
MPYPSVTKSLHHEMELVVAIGRGGRNIAVADALSHVPRAAGLFRLILDVAAGHIQAGAIAPDMGKCIRHGDIAPAAPDGDH